MDAEAETETAEQQMDAETSEEGVAAADSSEAQDGAVEGAATESKPEAGKGPKADARKEVFQAFTKDDPAFASIR